MVDFGTRLKELRRQRGWTQQQLADKLGVTKSVVSYYELRERSPSPEILIKLSGLFRVSSDYLLGINSNRTVDVSALSEEDIRAVCTIVQSLGRKK